MWRFLSLVCAFLLGEGGGCCGDETGLADRRQREVIYLLFVAC